MANSGTATVAKPSAISPDTNILVRKTSIYRVNISPVERRRHRRLEISIPVRLFVRGQLLAVADSLDISSGGLCLANPGIKLNTNQLVIVNFSIADFNCLTQAMVVYANEHRIGLMFAEDLPRNCLKPDDA